MTHSTKDRIGHKPEYFRIIIPDGLKDADSNPHNFFFYCFEYPGHEPMCLQVNNSKSLAMEICGLTLKQIETICTERGWELWGGYHNSFDKRPPARPIGPYKIV